MSSAPTTSDAPGAAPPADHPTGGAPADGATPGTTRAGVVIAVLVVSAFVMILNETILSVALKDLTVDLGVSTTTVQWLTSGFLLTMAVVIPTTGFLLERFTPRQVFLASLTMFSLGTLISALAPGFPVLLVGRVVQACGTAVMIPLLMTSIMRLVPPERRGSTMGTITIVIAVAPAIGPTIGGAVLASLSWRWMFWIVLPLALAALIVGAILMRLPSETRSVPLDLFSVLLSALGFGGILYGFSTIGEAGGGAALPPWVPLVIGAVALVLFVARQLALQKRRRGPARPAAVHPPAVRRLAHPVRAAVHVAARRRRDPAAAVPPDGARRGHVLDRSRGAARRAGPRPARAAGRVRCTTGSVRVRSSSPARS